MGESTGAAAAAGSPAFGAGVGSAVIWAGSVGVGSAAIWFACVGAGSAAISKGGAGVGAVSAAGAGAVSAAGALALSPELRGTASLLSLELGAAAATVCPVHAGRPPRAFQPCGAAFQPCGLAFQPCGLALLPCGLAFLPCGVALLPRGLPCGVALLAFLPLAGGRRVKHCAWHRSHRGIPAIGVGTALVSMAASTKAWIVGGYPAMKQKQTQLWLSSHILFTLMAIQP